MPGWRVLMGVWWITLACSLCNIAQAQTQAPSSFVLDAAQQLHVRHYLLSQTPAGARRIEIELGALDARLRLTPCVHTEPYLPLGTRAWGKTRVGLRCVQGERRWNVSLPIHVKVMGPTWVTRSALPAGHVLTQEDVQLAEMDWAAQTSAPLPTDTSAPVGRALVRALSAGEALRETHLKPRQWFVAGEVVRIRAQGRGFAVAGAGEALTAGIEGLPARVRLEGGRIVTGRAVGERLLELGL